MEIMMVVMAEPEMDRHRVNFFKKLKTDRTNKIKAYSKLSNSWVRQKKILWRYFVISKECPQSYYKFLRQFVITFDQIPTQKVILIWNCGISIAYVFGLVYTCQKKEKFEDFFWNIFCAHNFIM